WVMLRPTDEDLIAVVQMVNTKDEVVAESAVPIGGAGGQTSSLRANDVAIEAHRIVLPSSIAQYNLRVGIPRANRQLLDIPSFPERLDPEARRYPSQVVVDSVDAK